MSKKEGVDFEIAPLRPLGDFLLDYARFQIPNFKDLEKWGNRVVSNLLYYQSNYFLLAVAVFVVIGVIHPLRMLCGCLTTGLIFALFIYVTNEQIAAARFKQRHPIISLLLIFGSLYFIAYMFQSLLVFSMGIMLPVSAIFVHASLRLRNMKNKIVNKVEGLGLKTTLMGLLLQELGIESEIF